MSRNPTPFFAIESQQPSNGGRGRLLLLTYHFPPGQSAGALRWQRLTTHAAAIGWGLDVVTVDPASLRQHDPSRLATLPPGTRVYGVPDEPLFITRVERVVWNALQRLRRSQTASKSAAAGGGPQRSSSTSTPRPQSLGRAEILELRWSRRVAIRTYYWYLYHRRNARWAQRAAALGRQLLSGEHRAVITCGPPHEIHLTGSMLARHAGLPHVMDMRDPWSLAERVPEVISTPALYRTAARHERTVMQHVALAVCNTDPARAALQRLYPDQAGRCVTVMNGFDAEPLPTAARAKRFLLAYAGSIYLDRTPRALFRAAKRVIDERGLTPDDFAIEFMGSEEYTGGQTLAALADQEGIGAYVRVHPAGPRAEALRFLAGAAMLVSLPQDSRMAIPSKVFEYMLYDAWLLALADHGSATQQILEGSGADVVDPTDTDGLARVLAARYDEYRTSGPPRQPALVSRCDRAEQARILFNALDDVLGRPTRESGSARHVAAN